MSRIGKILKIESFDLIMLTVVLVLLLALGGVIARGDQVGISVQKFGPSDTVSSKAILQITFDEPIQQASAESHIHVTPTINGKVTVVDKVIAFQPVDTFKPGQSYTLTVQAGMVASSGRLLKQDAQWQFSVRGARIVYLVDTVTPSLYLYDPANGKPEKIINSQPGISEYDVSPDGSQIVYSELQDNGSSTFSVWDSATRQIKVLLTCDDSLCANPVWRPDGAVIAYEKQPKGTLVRAPHVWLLDVAANSIKPLFKDNQQLNEMPRWSPDGTRIAVLSTSAGAILIHDFSSETDTSIPLNRDTFGGFSPDGKWLFVSKDTAPGQDLIAAHIVLLDVSANPITSRDVIPDSDPANDQEAIWRANSQGLIVVRHRPFSQQTVPGSQLYNVEIVNGTAKALTADDGLEQRNLKLSPAGDSVVFERIAPGKPNVPSEIWTVNLATDELKLIAKGGFDPRWLP